MDKVTNLSKQIDKKLAVMDRQQRSRAIEQLRDLILNYELSDTLSNEAEHMPTKPIACPHCGSVLQVRYGKRNKRQRYKCKDCGRTHTSYVPKTIIDTSNLSRSVWMKYIACFVDGLSIRRCAANCGISVASAYSMRLRILNVIQQNQQVWHVNKDESVQLDETFVLESFKGNRTHCTDFKMPRPAYLRGRNQKGMGPTRSRGGNSSDTLCIICGIDDFGEVFLDICGRRKLVKSDTQQILSKYIRCGATVITDENNSYIELLKNIGATHLIKTANIPQGELNHVNTLHSTLSAFLSAKKGVSSRRLSLYLAEFAWRWTYCSHDTCTRDSADKVISQIAKTAYSKKLCCKDTPYPYIDYWNTSSGKKESERISIARKVYSANTAIEKAKTNSVYTSISEERTKAAKEALLHVTYPENAEPSRVGAISGTGKLRHASVHKLRRSK